MAGLELRRNDYVDGSAPYPPYGGGESVADGKFITFADANDPATSVDYMLKREPHYFHAVCNRSTSDLTPPRSYITDHGKYREHFLIRTEIVGDDTTELYALLRYATKYWFHYGDTTLRWVDDLGYTVSVDGTIGGFRPKRVAGEEEWDPSTGLKTHDIWTGILDFKGGSFS